MATNKHATIRYQALDRCFSNIGRRYYIEDLIEACNKAIYEFSGIEEGVKRRQVFDDISFMESDQGWSIPLLRCKDGRRVYYCYQEPHFSINNQPLNETEAAQLKESLLILNRFKGMPQFEWITEIITRLESSFSLQTNSSNIVGFENNPYLKGLDFFSTLFNAIVNKQVLKIYYKGFGKEEISFVLHPYYLKQYNNRWFLFALNDEYKTITNVPLDRIQSIEVISTIYIENKIIDFDEYFEDVIGVTMPINGSVEIVRLKVSKKLLPYIQTKPIHGSQKMKEQNDEYAIVELNVYINYELEAMILSRGEDIEVISPDSLRKRIYSRIEKLILEYK